MKMIPTTGWLASILAHLVIIFSFIPLINNKKPLSLQSHSTATAVIISAHLISYKHPIDARQSHQKHQSQESRNETKVADTTSYLNSIDQLIWQTQLTKPAVKYPKEKPTPNLKTNTLTKVKQHASIKKSNTKLTSKTIAQLLKLIHQQLQVSLWQLDPSLYQGHQGQVMLSFILTPKHSITHLQILQSSGYQQLDKIAIKLLKNLKTSEIKIPPLAESVKLELPVNFEQGL
ncbi:energy transducer TonB [Thiotrichales bacterium 19S3-7]|nr:energy transducer TonB [Thiotrichales bacterium 19S3-7]MCF6800904.1 energy transducer TonB [Thiotrichales bacterium 19S3-11]